MNIPAVSVEQMRKADEISVRHFGIEVLQLMENAGRAAADFSRQILKGLEHKRIVVLAGKGHNGGDALVAARFLHSWGANVDVILADHPDKLEKLTRDNSGVLRSMHVQLLFPTDLMKFELLFKSADLVIDGLLGYGMIGDPRGSYADVIRMANSSGKKILSIDCPSGIDSDSGQPYNPCISAKWTLTLALPKKGLANRPEVGELYLADIGIPPEVYQVMGMDVPLIFNKMSIIKVRT